MKKISYSKMTDTIITKRKELQLTQTQLAEKTGINRAMISRLESQDYIPSIDQLQTIAETLGFEVIDLFENDKATSSKRYNIAVAGTGYVGLSIATLLSQHNHVTAGDIIPEKVELINNKKSPIQDDYIEKYLAEKDGQIETVLQEPQLGTGHAVMQAQSFIDKHLDDDIIILNGDGPLIDAETINKAFDYHKENDNSITLISAIVDDTNGIGHIQRDENGKLLRIIEHKDANDEEK